MSSATATVALLGALVACAALPCAQAETNAASAAAGAGARDGQHDFEKWAPGSCTVNA